MISPTVLALASLAWSLEGSPAVGGPPGAPPGDVVVFIAKDLPFVFRLDGDRPVPFGDARFCAPRSLVADARGITWVLDEPAPGAGAQLRLWRVLADGTSAIVARSDRISADQNLGIDAAGRVLLVDGSAGVLRLEPDGSLTTVARAERGDLRHVACATAAPGGGLFAACRYVAGARGLYSQGALLRLDDSRLPASASVVLQNVQPGRSPEQTWWRRPTQLLVDGAGRLVLVDSGVPESDLLGGILVLAPDGHLVDLTYATPDGRCAPLRHPTGIAVWSRDTWLVADPLMYPGAGSSGGLFLLGADGSRGRTWRFGSRCRPIGVGVLRGVDAPAVPAAVPFAAYAGRYVAGPARVLAAAGFRQEATGVTVAGQFIHTGYRDVPLEPQAAAAALQSGMQGARWRIGPSGAIVIAAAGSDADAADGGEGPGVCRGTADLFHSAMAFATVSRGATRTDSRKSFVRGALTANGDGSLQAHAFVFRAVDGTLQGEIEQTLRPLGGPPVPAGTPAGDVAGTFTAAAPDAFGFVAWTREVIAGEPGSPSYGLYAERRPQPRDQAIATVRQMLAGSTWRFASDGTLEVRAPRGRLAGTVDAVGDERLVSVSAMLDGALWCLLSGRIERLADGRLIAWLSFDHAWQRDQLRAEFACALVPPGAVL
ncbi:MAG: hypothetical protein IPM29_25805 [Planctomycetes bacterium]|nr:hypothetical protein [Planctomycetota bacterium]